MAKQIFNGMIKKNKNLIWWGIGLVFIAGLIVLFTLNKGGEQSDKTIYSASVLSAVENTFDFNAISMKDGNVSHRFELKNNGTEPILIEKVYTSCMCTTASIVNASGENQGTFGMPGHAPLPKANIEVKSGESIFADVVFDPAAHGPQGTGKIKRIVYFETNSRTQPKLQLSFEANVTN